MIQYNQNDEIVGNGAIYITDIIRLCEYVKPFHKKLQVKLRKEEHIDYKTNYPFEVYYATRIFNVFIKEMLKDVIFNNICYKHNTYKSLYLVKETHPQVISSRCKYTGALPNMPIYSVTLKMKYKNEYLYKRMSLFGELAKQFKE